MAGHLIWTLIASEDLAPVSNVTTWDGRDQDGRSVFAGTYALNPGTKPPSLQPSTANADRKVEMIGSMAKET